MGREVINDGPTAGAEVGVFTKVDVSKAAPAYEADEAIIAELLTHTVGHPRTSIRMFCSGEQHRGRREAVTYRL